MFSTIGFQLRDTVEMSASHEGLMTAPILVVDEVSETRCVYDSQAETNTILFNVYKLELI